VLTAALPAAAGWDSADTLAVNLSKSAGVISGASMTSAQQGVTLSLIDAELLAYETATLTGANAYALTGLARGLDGTTGAAHASGAAFARLDGAIVTYALPSNMIGRTIYLKFQSFNIFGAGVQNLAACVAYPYEVTGNGGVGAVTAALGLGTNLDYSLVSLPASEDDDFGLVSTPASTQIDLGLIAS